MNISPGSARSTERAQAQQDRILAAAQKCFVDYGFHAAGMALIAQTAEMSQGLIYRYFKNKNAIILAIVERELRESQDAIRALYHSRDFVQATYDFFRAWCRAQEGVMSAALYMEMSAEASRSPELALALRANDLELRRKLSKWLAASVSDGGCGLSAEAAPVRGLCLQVFMDGLTVRALREPNIAPAVLKAAIARFLDELFSQPEVDASRRKPAHAP